MLEKLIELDKNLFLAINGSHNDFFDRFFYLFSQKEVWIPCIIAILYVLIKAKKKESIWLILGLILSILLADQVCSSILKPWVARLRPSRAPELTGLVHLIKDYTGGKFGFASSHAGNSFAVAAFLGLLFRNKTFGVIIFSWAILNSYSRIYIGVHYPLDIIAGTIIGLSSALISFTLLKKIKPNAINMTSNKADINNRNILKLNNEIHIVSLIILISILLLIILNQVLFAIF